MQNNTFQKHPLLLISPLIIASLIFISYWGTWNNSFQFDDLINIVEHQPLHISDLTFQNLLAAGEGAMLGPRPLPSITFAIDWWRGNGSAAPFQWTNLLIHIGNALLIWWLLFLLLQRWQLPPKRLFIIALASALLWALHPIQVQGVTYIVQRMAQMATLFTLLAMIGYIKGRIHRGIRRWLWFALATVAMFLGVISKENAWMIPLLWVMAEYGICRPAETRMLNYRHDYLIIGSIIGVVIFVLFSLVMKSGPLYEYISPGFAIRDFTMEERLLTQPRVILFHLGQIFWPLPGRFGLEHDFILSTSIWSPWSTLPAILIILIISGIGLWLLARASVRQRITGFLILFIPATLAIESSALPLEMVFEHRFYLPSITLFTLLVLGVDHLIHLHTVSTQRAVLAFGLLILIALSWSTHLRTLQWRTPLSLAQQNIITAPSSSRAWLYLGITQAEKESNSQGLEALNEAIRLDPLLIEAYINRAIVYGKMGQIEQARNDFQHASRLNSTYIRPYIGLGTLERGIGNYSAAMSNYQRARTLLEQGAAGNVDMHSPINQAVLYYQIGLTYAGLKQYPEAVEAYRRTVELNPQLYEAHFNRGTTLFRLQQFAEANQSLLLAQRINDNDPDLYYYLARIYLNQGEIPKALAALSDTIRLNPADGESLYIRSKIYQRTNNPSKASADLSQSCRLGYQPACNNI